MDPALSTAGPASAPTPQEEPVAVAAAAGALVRDRVAIGASAGGLAALKLLVGALPADYPGAIFIVMHLSPEARSALAAILAASGPLRTAAAEDGMPIEPGRIYVAPPDVHLLVERDRLAVTHGPRENRHRPAIDPLFRSVAWTFGPRAIGVVLSGNLDDGTAGLWAIKSCGGTTVVQEPTEAEHPDMPTNALMHNRIDHRLPVAGIAALIVRLAREPVAKPPPRPRDTLAQEISMAHGSGGIDIASSLGAPTAFTCPTCRGALWQLEEGGHLRYRCHTGHAFSQASLLLDQSNGVEVALYAALRAVEEKATALRRISERWAERFPQMHGDYQQRATEMDHTAEVLRRLLAGEVPRPA